jgi:hypothetical protein
LWYDGPSDKKWEMNDLWEYSKKVGFYAFAVEMFTLFVLQRGEFYGTPKEMRDAWLDIFLQPLVYPPPEDHPSRRFAQKLDTPPPPSPA